VKTKWDRARKPTTGEKVIKKPTAVIIDVNAATAGDMNIAINIGTWLAKVNDAGSILILIGEYSGMIMPIALSNAAIVMVLILILLLFIIYLPLL